MAYNEDIRDANQSETLYIKKRSGKRVPFDKMKIVTAIEKSNNDMSFDYQKLENENIIKIADGIEHYARNLNRELGVEEIQDMVECEIMQNKKFELARNYITYRYKQNEKRNKNSLDKRNEMIIENQSEDAKEENSNKNPEVLSVQRDYIAGEWSRHYTRNYILPKHIIKAHDEGLIHFHDSDYAAQHYHNCCLINLDDMLQNGTKLSGVPIYKPKSFATAATLTSQIIAQVASAQYGGQTITLTHLAPFVDISRQKIRKRFKTELTDAGLNPDEKTINEIAEKELLKEVKAGCQTIQYQLITLQTTNGQAPFVTIFMYLNEAKDPITKKDLALLIEIMLKQRIEGIKSENGISLTPAFPKLIYVLSENNIYASSKYYYLTKLAAECSTKRLVPDYISEKIMKELKGDVYPCMGCVDKDEVITYKLNNNIYTESFERMWNRLSEKFKIKIQPNNIDYYIDTPNVKIYDQKKGFVDNYRIIKNHNNKWLKIIFTNGRILTCTPDHPFETEGRGLVLAKDLKKSDLIKIDRISDFNNKTFMYNTNDAWLYGLLLCDDIYYTRMTESNIDLRKTLEYLFEGKTKENRHIPNKVFSFDVKSKIAFIAGMLNANGYNKHNIGLKPIQICTENKELAIQQMLLIQTIGINALLYETYLKEENKNIYTIELTPNKELYEYIKYNKKPEKEIENFNVNTNMTILNIIEIEKEGFSYDVTTESEHFTVSGIYSHNCRSFLTPDRFTDKKLGNIANAKNYKENEHKYYGRFNQGVVTINLVDVACSSNKDKNKFWEILEERLNICHEALQIRHKRLLGVKSDIAPIQWQDGALARLKPNEPIDKLLFNGYSTISLGFAGLYECTYYMTNESHTQENGKKFAIEVMQKLNDACNKWKLEENIDYSLYGTPLESTTYKFAKCLQKRFGIIKGVTDKNYITNSYHIHVSEKINAFDKLTKESEFQKLSPGGAVSYVEIPDMKQNLDAVITILQHIYNTILYAELNTKSDFCENCGFDGEIQIVKKDGKYIWKCPNCDCEDEHKLHVARRTCGYIGTQFWNQGRTQEIKDRVLHLSIDK